MDGFGSLVDLIRIEDSGCCAVAVYHVHPMHASVYIFGAWCVPQSVWCAHTQSSLSWQPALANCSRAQSLVGGLYALWLCVCVCAGARVYLCMFPQEGYGDLE